MNTTTQNTVKALLAATTLVAALATNAHAADAPQVRVSYADLNVHSPAGAAVLNRRIKAAAEQVCQVFSDREPAHRAQFDACVTGAMAGALATVRTADVQMAYNK